MIKASLLLFKCLPLQPSKYTYSSKNLVKSGLSMGYVFDPKLYKYYSKDDMLKAHAIVKEFIMSGNEMNATFHKSWAKVKNAPYGQLIIEQMAHYVTTYGFEELGLEVTEDSVYIPREVLDVPEIYLDKIQLINIKALPSIDIEQKVVTMLSSGIAFKEDTQRLLIELMDWYNIIDLDIVKNKELRMHLYQKLNEVPSVPVEFLRYIVYLATGGTILIKNRETIKAIKGNVNPIAFYIDKYIKEHGAAPLSTIFYRFKPLWLAFKNVDTAKYINKLRNSARIHHKPMAHDYLNDVTYLVKKGLLDIGTLEENLKKANPFRKVRLLQALNFRITNCESIVYRVRNGKSYATNLPPYMYDPVLLEDAKTSIKNSLVEDVKDNVAKKVIYIPDGLHYAVPSTEKQFTGMFPSGSYLEVPRGMVFGINWKNQAGYRVDLDLSVINASGKYGWDGLFRGSEGNLLFSGDVTDAGGKDGACELFLMNSNKRSEYIMYVNYYNYNKDVPVPFKIVVGSKEGHSINRNYMLDSNNVKAFASSVIDKKMMILGLATVDTKKCRFYFAQSDQRNIISSQSGVISDHNRIFYTNFLESNISLNDLLLHAGAVIVNTVIDKDIDGNITHKEIDINLSHEKLEKDTIINILNKSGS